ncbi:MAG: ABC transporter ATP-binding protein [Paenibacillus sp.]|nr:ABC transporter ATP-binding protein [Paenibacillus sp.]
MAKSAIEVINVSKTFRIPHEKSSTLKHAALHLFSKKTYQEFVALDNVSFEIEKGEFFGIIGRNGSGKSTLLKILAGIYVHDSGKVIVNGKLSPFLELGVGFNPELTARENIYLGGAILGLTKKEVDQKFKKIIEFSELEDFVDMRFKNFSSGMQVRLAFSLAINAHAEILLMDEVLAVGDTNFQNKCLEEFNSYKRQGKTVVLVTHDLSVVRKYCDRAMLLRKGKVELIGDTSKVCDKYLNQNMEEEEQRIKSERQNISTAADKTSTLNSRRNIAKIVKIRFEHKGKEANIFETGQELDIVVTYKIMQAIKNPIFGIIVKDSRQNHVFITNTDFKKMRTGTFGKNSEQLVEVRFSIKNYLTGGQYFVSPAIADENAKIFFDWREDLGSFMIVNKDFNSGGFVDFEHNITIE